MDIIVNAVFGSKSCPKSIYVPKTAMIIKFGVIQ